MQQTNLNVFVLCPVEEIEEGKAKGIDLYDEGKDQFFLVRFKGLLYAWRNDCPHTSGAAMAWRKDGYMTKDGTHICCHVHGAIFKPDTGLCVQGPCLGDSLTPVAIEINDQGWIQLKEQIR